MKLCFSDESSPLTHPLEPHPDPDYPSVDVVARSGGTPGSSTRCRP